MQAAVPTRAIIIGGHVNALGLVRTFAEHRIKVGLITTQAYDMAHCSKYIAKRAHCANLENNPVVLVRELMRWDSAWAGATLVPSSDRAVEILSEHRDELSSLYRLAIPGARAVEAFLDRQKMNRAAQQAGLKLPRCFGLASDLARNADELPYPFLVKPLRSGQFFEVFGFKLFAINDASELKPCLEKLAAAGIDGEVFEYVPGPDREIFAQNILIDENNRLKAACTVRKLRQTPALYGVSRVAECIPLNPELQELALSLLKTIGHQGFASVEFKHDSRDGSWRFLEVNGRSVIYNRLLEKSGVSLVNLVDESIPRAMNHTDQWQGAWINIHADLLRSSLQSRKDEAVGLRDYLAPYRGKKIFAVWDWKDPMPFVCQWWISIRSLPGRLIASFKPNRARQRNTDEF